MWQSGRPFVKLQEVGNGNLGIVITTREDSFFTEGIWNAPPDWGNNTFKGIWRGTRIRRFQRHLGQEALLLNDSIFVCLKQLECNEQNIIAYSLLRTILTEFLNKTNRAANNKLYVYRITVYLLWPHQIKSNCSIYTNQQMM